MSRKKIVAGNWKMNLNWSEASELAVSIRNQAKEISQVEKIIFPPFPYLHLLSDLVKHESNFYIGAQNCSEHSKGAYTGEVSADMIHSAGSAYVLVGHSERRQYYDESADQLCKKIDQALQSGLKVIFCFGEKLSERKSGEHFETVRRQLKDVLSHFPTVKVSHLVLAYEPVWAIGTGETASPEQAQEMHAYIRKQVSVIFDANIANDMSILYGGSCNAQNAKELFACADVDGGLIGGASLKADDFCTIMTSFT